MHKELSQYKKIVESKMDPPPSEPGSINDNSEEMQIYKVSKVHSGLIARISNPSEAVQLAAVTRNGLTLKTLYEKGIDPSEAVQLAAVNENSAALNFIPDPSENVKLSAVEHDEYAILNLLERNLSNDKLLMIALNKDVFMVDKVDDNSLITPAVKRLILSKLLLFIKLAETDQNYIKEARDLYLTLRYKGLGWPEFATLEKHLKAKNILKESLSEDDLLTAVTVDPLAIQNIKNPSEAVQLAALREYKKSIDYDTPWWEEEYIKFLELIENPSEQLQLAMVDVYGSALQVIVDQGITPSEAVQLAAVNENGFAISHIKDPSEQIQLAAIKTTPESIDFIKRPTEKVQIVAIKKDSLNTVGTLIETHLIKLSPRVQMVAVLEDPLVLVYFEYDFDVNTLLKSSEVKRAVLTCILSEAKFGYMSSIEKMYKLLKKNNIQWPELAVIKNNLEAKFADVSL